MSDDDLVLSSAALAALREFALEKGVALDESDEEGNDDGDKSAALHVLDRVRDHFDLKDKEDTFSYTFGSLSLKFCGLKREIGQTLSSTGLTVYVQLLHHCRAHVLT